MKSVLGAGLVVLVVILFQGKREFQFDSSHLTSASPRAVHWMSSHTPHKIFESDLDLLLVLFVVVVVAVLFLLLLLLLRLLLVKRPQSVDYFVTL